MTFKYHFGISAVVDNCIDVEAENYSQARKLLRARKEELVRLLEDFMKSAPGGWDYDGNVNDEHGNYHAPDNPPLKYEDEEDYYERHDEIVTEVCNALEKIREFIASYEDRINKEVR